MYSPTGSPNTNFKQVMTHKDHLVWCVHTWATIRGKGQESFGSHPSVHIEGLCLWKNPSF